MMKTLNSQQVESSQAKGISQQVERDASSPSLDSSVSFRVSIVITHYEHHVQNEKDTKDVIEDPSQRVRSKILLQYTNPKEMCISRHDYLIRWWPMRFREVEKDSIPCSFREAELTSDSKLWTNTMMEEIESLHVNNT